MMAIIFLITLNPLALRALPLAGGENSGCNNNLIKE